MLALQQDQCQYCFAGLCQQGCKLMRQQGAEAHASQEQARPRRQQLAGAQGLGCQAGELCHVSSLSAAGCPCIGGQAQRVHGQCHRCQYAFQPPQPAAGIAAHHQRRLVPGCRRLLAHAALAARGRIEWRQRLLPPGSATAAHAGGPSPRQLRLQTLA